jgi:hypothetical protein
MKNMTYFHSRPSVTCDPLKPIPLTEVIYGLGWVLSGPMVKGILSIKVESLFGSA